jgi:hypothetical protein
MLSIVAPVVGQRRNLRQCLALTEQGNTIAPPAWQDGPIGLSKHGSTPAMNAGKLHRKILGETLKIVALQGLENGRSGRI